MARSRLILSAIFFVAALTGCSLLPSTKPLVKIGLVAPFEGVYRGVGYEALYAVRVALRECNERGGVGGYMVELVALDDGGDAAHAVQQARELLLDPLVVGAIGHFGEATTLAAAPIYQEGGLALLAPGVVSKGLEAYPGVLRLGADQDALNQAVLGYAEGLGARRIAVLGKGVLSQASGASDMEIVPYTDVELLVAEAEKFDFILFNGDTWEAARLLTRLREVGVETPLLGGEGLNTPHFIAWAGEAAEESIYATSTVMVDEPQFQARYRELAGNDPGLHAALAYDATKLLLKAIEEAIHNEGDLTRGGVLAALKGEKGYEGLTGFIAFDEEGDQIDPPVYIYRVKSGYPERLWP